jgi:hypothetical protein
MEKCEKKNIPGGQVPFVDEDDSEEKKMRICNVCWLNSRPVRLGLATLFGHCFEQLN